MPQPPTRHTPTLDAMPVRGILLDVDGTLYHQRPLRLAMLARLLWHVATAPRVGAETLRVLRAYRHAQEALRLRPSGPVPVDVAREQCRVAAEEAGVDEARVRAIVERWMETEPLPLLAARRRAGVLEFLAAAAERDLPVGVVSDYPAAAKLERLGVAAHVRCVVCAQDADVGCFKPDPRGLLLAAERLGVAPAGVLYVGDRPGVDAAAAIAAGMRCAIVGVRPARTDPTGWLGVPDFHELGRRLALT